MRTQDALGSVKPQERASARSGRRLIALGPIKAVAEVSDTESEFILQGAGEITVATPGPELFRVGAQLSQPRVILSGWAGLCVIMADGRRQLLDFALPGDLVGFSLHAD